MIADRQQQSEVEESGRWLVWRCCGRRIPGARTPEETAISITAEIIAHVNQGTGLSLTLGTGPIHRPGHQAADERRVLDARS
jgi:hypothetical protein